MPRLPTSREVAGSTVLRSTKMVPGRAPAIAPSGPRRTSRTASSSPKDDITTSARSAAQRGLPASRRRGAQLSQIASACSQSARSTVPLPVPIAAVNARLLASWHMWARPADGRTDCHRLLVLDNLNVSCPQRPGSLSC